MRIRAFVNGGKSFPNNFDRIDFARNLFHFDGRFRAQQENQTALAVACHPRKDKILPGKLLVLKGRARCNSLRFDSVQVFAP